MTSPVSLCWNTVIGTPQARWREITQSGRDSIMPRSRFWPDGRHELRLLDGLQRDLAQRPIALTRAAPCPPPRLRGEG